VARASTALDPYTVVNISSTGAFLQTDRPIPVGTLLDLSIVLENQVSVGTAARVVRVQEPNWVKTAGVGIEFVGLDHRARQEIDRYVEDDPSPSSSGESTLEPPVTIPTAV
jgi:c-di-GMP-binding flagellar brake protein YcgR